MTRMTGKRTMPSCRCTTKRLVWFRVLNDLFSYYATSGLVSLSLLRLYSPLSLAAAQAIFAVLLIDYISKLLASGSWPGERRRGQYSLLKSNA